MLRIEVLTLFPEVFTSFMETSLIKKGIKCKELSINLVNFRKYGIGKHQKVDDGPYGGGPGMLLRVEPIALTLSEIKERNNEAGRDIHNILITPQGEKFNQKKAESLSNRKEVLSLICGRYQGFDERIRSLVDEEISGGDYICLGGEVIAMTIIEAVSRLRPNFIGNCKSSENESFTDSFLEFPQYTRPKTYNGMSVPKELLTGNHKIIDEWRRKNSYIKTEKLRPDLLKKIQI